jgi:hypothetical protein
MPLSGKQPNERCECMVSYYLLWLESGALVQSKAIFRGTDRFSLLLQEKIDPEADTRAGG